MGNIGLLTAGFAPRRTVLGCLRTFTLSMGLIAVVGSALFFAQQGIGIGVGGMERVAVFPLPVWALCVGATLAAYTRRRAASMGRLTSDDDDMETDTS